MRVCQVCFQPFKPAQTFESLFRLKHSCEVCEVLLESPIKESVLPIDNAECHIMSFEAKAHPAYFNIMLRTILNENIPVVFLEMIEHNEPIIWRLLGTLFDPLYIYTPAHLTLDEMEHIID